MKKTILMTLVGFVAVLAANAQSWIWYPGDMDIWMGNKIGNLRSENGSFYPQFWRADSHWQTVVFSKTVELAEPEQVELKVEGKQWGVRIDGHNYLFGMPSSFTIPQGRHTVYVTVSNLLSPPSIWLKGATVVSDTTWTTGNHARNEKADTWEGLDGKPLFADASQFPSQYGLPATAIQPEKVERSGSDLFAVFDKERMGRLRLDGVSGNGQINIYYGESPDEARDKRRAYQCDKMVVDADSATDLATMSRCLLADSGLTVPSNRAMRYVTVETTGDVRLEGVTLLSEMKDLGDSGYRGSFCCDDTLLNHIWQVAAYTLHLTDREVMIEGAKRDRWMWSGDAIQSYLMNYYSLMDQPVVKRTIWALRGKDPVEQHINTILDYSFYWFVSIYDYYLYTGDTRLIRQIYPRMQSLMAYIEGRLNDRGMVEGRRGDWVFVDWPPKNMPKDGELAFEQLVYMRSLEAMCLCAGIVGNQEGQRKYRQRAEELRSQILPVFWSDEAHALVHHTKGGVRQPLVTRYANIFAVLYGLLNDSRKQDVLENVMLNDSIMMITTPYMRFYELEALCALGQQERVLDEMRSYWGGMLREGATTFWETYDPTEQYPQRLAMYGHPYGKSQCHAWGASPIYLLGRYYLGVSPVKAGYEEWEARPCLGGLKWMRGDVPTPHGTIHLEMTQKTITIEASEGSGMLYFRSKGRPKASEGIPEAVGDGLFRLRIEAGGNVSVKY